MEFAMGFPYKHCNFWLLCLTVKMASKTVFRPIQFLIDFSDQNMLTQH